MGAMENENRITIPDFSKDDFLISSKPFQWIIDQADGNEFIKGQLVAQMADKAKELDVSNFRTQFKNYVRAQKGQSIVYGNVMEFSGTAIMWDTGEWIATDDGVYRFKGQFSEKVTACPHPIFMITRYSNVDTDVESVQLVYGRPGRNYKTKIVPRSDLASANKIVKLAEYGVGVTSENAKALVQFLSDFESINYDKIIEKKSCDHMGWVGRGFKEFAPYISDLEFEGQDSFRQLFNSVREVGSYEKWLKTIRDYRKNGNIVVRMVMAASFASVLLKPLGALPFFVHLWGDTETGKSVALLAAVSVWAEPVIGKYAYTFNSTDVGNELYAACLNSLPLCMDELQILNKRSDFDDIIYRLCEGTGRLRGKKDGGIQNIKTWRNCNGGKFFKNPREFCRTIQSSYGHAGKVFVENLTENLAEARELHEKYIKLLEDNTDATDKQIASAAALLTADELSERCIFNDGIRIGIDDIKPYLQTKDMLNVNRRAYDYLREEVISNYNNFKNNDNECWGIAKEGYIYILRNKFNAILQSGNFNPQSTLSWMARNGKLAKTDGRNLSVKVQINGTRIRCICLHEDDGEFTEMDIDDEDLPFDI